MFGIGGTTVEAPVVEFVRTAIDRFETHVGATMFGAPRVPPHPVLAPSRAPAVARPVAGGCCVKTTPLDAPRHRFADLGRLPDADVPAAEALVSAMADWRAVDLAAYRESVLDEAERSCGPARGFLAVELAALAQLEAVPH